MGYKKAIPQGIATIKARAPRNGEFEAEHFDSVAEFFAPRPMTTKNAATYASSIEHNPADYTKKKAEWFGVADADAVIDAIHDGWPEGAKRMRDTIGSVQTTQTAQSIRRVLCRGDHGDEFDIHRAYAGGLDKAWTRRKRGMRPSSKGVTLVLHVGGAWTVTAEELFWRGAAAACLADLLSEAGYAVTIIVGAGIRKLADGRADTAYQYTVTAKASHMPVDIDTIAAVTALAGTFRVGGFRKIAERPYDIGGHFGTTASLNLSAIPADSPILVPANVKGREAAESWLAKAIQEITGEALPA